MANAHGGRDLSLARVVGRIHRCNNCSPVAFYFGRQLVSFLHNSLGIFFFFLTVNGLFYDDSTREPLGAFP